MEFIQLMGSENVCYVDYPAQKRHRRQKVELNLNIYECKTMTSQLKTLYKNRGKKSSGQWKLLKKSISAFKDSWHFVLDFVDI